MIILRFYECIFYQLFCKILKVSNIFVLQNNYKLNIKGVKTLVTINW